MGDDNMFADVSGALGACMRAVWKRNDRPWPKPEGVEPSATIDDLAELSAVIRSWGLRKPTARLPIQRSAWKGYSKKFAGTTNGATPHKKRAGRLVPALDVSF
jgi:hypothetical protein